ncbi:hypothetical protein A6770_19715 [Nostoc minutum NIES-26]|uniref:Uncharacterized protein n=1 Tax=Nostoc minutum NIES-26 TaxID=1844469 RepID=A0A367R530_9NOSO|nr:hypothetical protein A6770_19715 [Nostoc minutum NIES-26]
MVRYAGAIMHPTKLKFVVDKVFPTCVYTVAQGETLRSTERHPKGDWELVFLLNTGARPSARPHSTLRTFKLCFHGWFAHKQGRQMSFAYTPTPIFKTVIRELERE